MLPRVSKRWVIQQKISKEIDQELVEYPAFFRQILYSRGIQKVGDARSYLLCETPYPSRVSDLLGLDTAVEILNAAIEKDLPMVVYGDYDVDGVTATALLVQVLGACGAQVEPYIPNRFDEGYGLNIEALEKLAAEGVGLVITVDCGIRSPLEAQRARELGLQLIISDHHNPGSELPKADAVICPKQQDDPYPDKNLSGVGVAYKIAQGLALRRPQDHLYVEDYLDLVALGTVADVVPLTGENRMLVRGGLEKMRSKLMQDRPGLFALANMAGVKIARLTATDLAFMLGPRLNAAGRLETAQKALQLLLIQDRQKAGFMAQELDNQNRQRQDLTRKTQEEAIQRMQGAEAREILFAFDEHYNPGIVGLVASRLVDHFYRPAVVGHIDGEFTRASCRSIPEFHITQALDECSDLLVRHGGHALAAGFTIRNENVPELTERLSEIAARHLSEKELRPVLRADMEISLVDLKPEFLKYLEWLQPTGQENPEAVFVSRNLRVTNSRRIGNEGQHLRLTVTDGRITYDAVAFRQGYRMENRTMPERIDMMYVFEQNEYNGRVSLQLNVRDLKATGLPD